MNTFNHDPHNWLIHKIIFEHMEYLAPKYASGVLLDIGCGQKPYKNLLSHYIDSYYGLDYKKNDVYGPTADIYADASLLPIKSESMDTVLLTEVLEHLAQPLYSVKEIHRILRPGGYLIITTPLFWHLHEQPRDYYRYTKYGLHFLLETAGLQIIETTELTGAAVTFIQLGIYALFCYIGYYKLIRRLIFPLIWAFQRIAYYLNKRDKTRDFSCITAIVACKSL